MLTLRRQKERCGAAIKAAAEGEADPDELGPSIEAFLEAGVLGLPWACALAELDRQQKKTSSH